MDTPFDFAQGRLCPSPLTLFLILTLTSLAEFHARTVCKIIHLDAPPPRRSMLRGLKSASAMKLSIALDLLSFRQQNGSPPKP
jgi:hypothetical protein